MNKTTEVPNDPTLPTDESSVLDFTTALLERAKAGKYGNEPKPESRGKKGIVICIAKKREGKK